MGHCFQFVFDCVREQTSLCRRRPTPLGGHARGARENLSSRKWQNRVKPLKVAAAGEQNSFEAFLMSCMSRDQFTAMLYSKSAIIKPI